MTECISQLELGFLPRKQIVPRLEGGRVSSDGGPVSPASGLWRQLACAGRRICHKPLRALRGLSRPPGRASSGRSATGEESKVWACNLSTAKGGLARRAPLLLVGRGDPAPRSPGRPLPLFRVPTRFGNDTG